MLLVTAYAGLFVLLSYGKENVCLALWEISMGTLKISEVKSVISKIEK
jgi:hypothetical protein